MLTIGLYLPSFNTKERAQSQQQRHQIEGAVSLAHCMHAKLLQSSPTVCDPMDCSPPGSSVHGILQAKILKWVAGLPPGDPPNPGIQPTSKLHLLHWQADSLPLCHLGSPHTTRNVSQRPRSIEMHPPWCTEKTQDTN